MSLAPPHFGFYPLTDLAVTVILILLLIAGSMVNLAKKED
jgi:hypothetical protein